MKKLIILASLSAMNAQGMPVDPSSCNHIRMCSAPGGLWSLEKEPHTHHRTFSAPADIKLSVNQESKDPYPNKFATNSRSKKRKSPNFKKKPDEKPSELKKGPKPKPESHEPINSIKQCVIDARNHKQKTDQNVKKVLKKKSFEKKFTNFLGDNIGKFVADKLFDFFTPRE